MADPFTWVAIGSMAVSAAAGGVSAYGQAESGKLKQQMYQYRQKVALEDAKYQSMLGERKAGEEGLKQAQVRGHIAAELGAHGLDVDRGSAQDVQKSQKAVDLITQEDIRDAARRRAYGDVTQGQLYGAAGTQERFAGDIGSTATILGTAGSVASKWATASTLGAGGGGIDTGVGLSPFGGSKYFG